MQSASQASNNSRVLKNCHYHPEKVLTHICLDAKCLLPLCEKCLPIHIEQLSHFNTDQQYGNNNSSKQSHLLLHKQNIVNIDAAKERAISEMQSQIQASRQYTTQFNNLRTNIISATQNILNQLYNCSQKQIMGNQLSEDKKIIKINKIQDGNLAEMIFYYQSNIDKPNREWKIQSHFDHNKIKQLFSSFISIQKIQNKQNQNKQNLSFLNKSPQFLQNVEFNESRIDHTVKSSQSIVHDKVLQCSRYTNRVEMAEPIQIEHKNIQHQLIRRPRGGIFVTTSPKLQTKLRYGSQSVQLKRSDQSLNVENSCLPTTHKQNTIEYVQASKHNLSNSLVSPSLLAAGHQQKMSQFSREISVSNSQSKLKVSLPKKVIFYKQSPKSKTTRNSTTNINIPFKSTQITNKKLEIRSNQKASAQSPRNEGIYTDVTPKSCNKELKNIINRRDLASNSSSRLTLKRTEASNRVTPVSGQKLLFQNECLNPQEMRELMMRRKNGGNGGNHNNIGLDCSSATERLFLEKLSLV